ncbi:metallothionein family protein [Pseudomonas sp. BCA14]|uniref:metallothionein family protein n=1 Tax=Pseudomonas TaxID=286 RepID=UPI000F4B043D|nr:MULTISPECIES: metallothionein family protein [Pseudomonas]TFF14520.1 metallothionein family protein [Pseudomonas sp. JMN1]TFF14796.1 metallothionein family protein [Pseudomonas sp. BCA17]TFF21579.1 metallothionein family protein [Pseudomonas sp. BCA13]TFF31202.1 metallothionein family protein [Pseudomonas sp. BCA14]
MSEPSLRCACSTCTCTLYSDRVYPRDGADFCSQACADMHPGGQPCPAVDCTCEQSVATSQRKVSDSQLDQALEESFPASDPISP